MRWSNVFVGVLALSCALVPFGADAQTSRPWPKFFVVNDGRPANVDPVPNDALRRMVWLYLTPAPSGNPFLRAEEAADQAATYIRAEIDAGRLASDDICITFNGLGRDYSDSDYRYRVDGAGPLVPGPWYQDRTVFFRPEDRLPNFMTPSAPGVPAAPQLIGEDSDLYFEFPAPTNFSHGQSSDRAYRHPFIINATSSSAPLRLWFETFMRRYHAQSPPLPTPSRLYLDIESS